MRRRFLGALVFVTAGALATTPASANGGGSNTLTFSVDVAEDFDDFVFTPLTPGAPPERGSFFVTEGKIYPAGTIPDDPSGFDPSQPGSLGTWFCSGTHLVAASEIPAAPVWVVTDQLYQLPGQERQLSTTGTEGNALSIRTVTGGTGFLKDWTGEQRQRFLGFNKTGGINLRVTFHLRRVSR